jgi:carbamoylphosphate synthase large subunit
MNVAVIGAYFDSVHAIKTARSIGYCVLALDADKNAEGLHHADKYKIVDIKNYEELYNILDDYDPKLVLPAPIGRYLTSIGAVNDHYGLPGVTLQAATYCTDKHVFHVMLHNKGKRQVEHILINAVDTEVPAATGTWNYPIVAKPRYGSGNRAVQIYMTPADFQANFLSQLPMGEDFVVESCIQGVEYGVDAAMIHNELHLVLLREKILTPSPYSQCVGYYAVPETESNRALFHSVREAVSEACKILGINNCLLHADVIDHNSEAFVIEISARPSGHYLHDLFTPIATGVDMIAEYMYFALPQLGKKYSFTPTKTKNMLIRYFDFGHCRVKYVPDALDLKARYRIREYKCSLQKGEVLQPITEGRPLMERGYFVIEGANRDVLDQISKKIMSEFVLEDVR